MARRGMWLIGGVAVGMGALVLKPETRTWLRRRLGMEAEDRRWFEEEDAAPAEHEGDEPLDTREARFSLRARLAEDGHSEAAPERAPLAAAPPLAPVESMPAPPLDPAFGSTPPVSAPEPEPESQPLAAAPEPEEAPLAAVPEPGDADLAPAADVTEAPAWADPPAAGDEPSDAPAADPPAATPWIAAAPDLAPEPEPEGAPEPEAASPAARALESAPQIGPEDEAPQAPGEDTSEIEAVPSSEAWQAPEPAPPVPPPIPLRPPAVPPAPPSRPFSESTSFRDAIDAARERVHGAAREATPDDESESSEPREERD